MDRASKTILVTGATGVQGGSATRKLLADGWRVRAITRNTGRPAAQALAALGVEVVKADLDDTASLAEAARGAYGVFSVQAAAGSDVPDDFEWQTEARWGKNLADAASAAGVEAFVYSSANGADTPMDLPILEAKWAIEEHIRTLGLPATVIRPTSFMENNFHPLVGLRNGKLMTALRPEVGQQLIAAEDIGAFIALAFAQPEIFRGKSLDIAGDDLTSPQIAEAISKSTGRSVEYVQIPIESLRERSEEAAKGYEWLNERKMTLADIPALRELHPGLLSFKTWLEQRGGKEKITAYLDSQSPSA
ncbi:NmrA/HSCARG family protein [Streptomyces sp. NPDC057307]|uniref:NmrA/HSCARG family protein n=1 Tax=Streptomyces sp. NPDC057307 TaxID=3346096 RepID=UPI003645031F